MKYFVAASVPLLGSMAVEQDVKHAPSAEQCRTERRLWLDKVESDTTFDAVSFSELTSRIREMHDCKSVDSDQQSRYYHTAGEIGFGRLMRQGLS